MNNNLEKLFKKSLEKHEMPYDPKAWEAVQKQLPNSINPIIKIGLISAASIAVITVATLFLFNSSDSKSEQIADVVQREVINSNEIDSDSKNADILIQDTSTALIKQNDTYEESVSQPVADKKIVEIAQAPNVQLNPIVNDVHVDEPNSITPEKKWLKNVQQAYIASTQSYVCSGENVVFTVVNTPENTFVEWIVNGQVYSDEIGKSLNIAINETTTVAAKLIPVEELKLVHVIPSIQVNVFEQQKIIVSVTKDTKHTKPYFTLENKNADISALKWSLDWINTKGPSLSTYLTDQGVYSYTVSGKDNNGCTVVKEGEIRLDESYNLYTPTAFSPNGDGINETFIPVALLSREVEFKMRILDRAGNLIYETTDKHKPWNGDSIKGGKVRLGNYVWVVTLINEEGLPEKYSGTIVITE